MQVLVDGILTSYKKEGSAQKSVLFLHGWGDSSKSFQTLANVLASKFTVLMVDLPGFGETQRPKTAWGIVEYARFVDKFLKKINTSPEIIIGHSNGGAIAIVMIGSQINSAKKLILLASSGVRTGSGIKKNILKVSAKAASVTIKILPKHSQKSVKEKLYKTIGSDYLVVPGMEESFKKVVGYDVVSKAKKISIPTLLIYGDQDSSTPISQAKILNDSIENSKLEIIHGASHFVHIDQFDQVKTRIVEFIK